MPLEKKFFFASLVIVLAFGCSYIERPDTVLFYLSPGRITGADEAAIRLTVDGLNTRKSGLRASPGRLREAYKKLQIRNLQDVPPEEYRNYRKFAEKDEGRVYIIVHPAYYPFFRKDLITRRINPDNPPSRNVVERFCAQPAFSDYFLVVMQEQERMLKDFLEVAAQEKKLVILILPSDYKSHLGYSHAEEFDEYIRYLNEVSGGSESVLYLQSLEFNSGFIGERALGALSKFLYDAGADTLMLGGEFAGRCLDNVHWSLLRKIDRDRIYIVPEITVMTHKDIRTSWGGPLATRDDIMQFISGKLDSPRISAGKSPPKQIRHLYIYEITDNNLRQIN